MLIYHVSGLGWKIEEAERGLFPHLLRLRGFNTKSLKRRYDEVDWIDQVRKETQYS
jgi:hypothetical protein